MKKTKTMKKRVFELVSQIMDIPEENVTSESSNLNLTGWDSLNHLTLVITIQEEFNVEFSDEQIIGMTNVAFIVSALEDLTDKTQFTHKN